MDRTEPKIDKPLPNGRSGPVRYELIDKDGNVAMISGDVANLALYAAHKWPDQEQDEDRTGQGWDVQVVGCDR